jgi:hypothetical protein
MSTETNVSDLRKGQSEAKEIPIDVTGVNWGAINITAKDLKVFVNGKETTKFTYNNSVITLTDAYKAGIYNLTIKYLGNSLFVASDKNIILTVYGINATTSRDVNSSKKVENITVKIIDGNNTIDVTLDDLNITVTYKDGNKTVDIVIKNTALNNGTLSFELENGNFTTATLSIRYNNTVTNVTLNRIYNVKIIPINTVNEYRDGTFTFKLEDLDDKNVVPAGITVRLTTVGNIRAGFTTTTDKDGIATYKTVNLYTFNKLDSSSATQFNLEQEELYVGNHLVDVETEGKGKSKKISVNLTITPANFEIVVPNFSEYYQTNKNFTAYVVNKKSKTPMANIPVTFKIVNSENKEVTYTNGATKQKITTIYTNSEGKISLPVGNLVGGTYTYRLTVEKSHNYNKVSKKGTFEIKKIPVVINAKDVTVTYNSGTTSTIKITKNGKGISGVYFVVRLYITSKKYEDYLFLSGKNGKYSFSASLNVGKHKMIINSADSRYGAKQVTKTITVKKASATIKAKKVTDYYKGAKTFNVKLINSKTKKPIYNAKLKIKISDSKKYYTYTGNTGINGQLKLALSNINPGKYKVEITGADNKNFAAKKVTSKIVIKKAPTKLTPKKLKAKKGAKKYFKVKVTNKKTKKVMSGVKIKIKVYTGKKYKTYTVKSNKKGIAKISTKKLKVGKHKVVVTSANKYCVAKKAKSSIKITKK